MAKSEGQRQCSLSRLENQITVKERGSFVQFFSMMHLSGGNGALSHILNVLLATLKVERKDATYITDVR